MRVWKWHLIQYVCRDYVATNFNVFLTVSYRFHAILSNWNISPLLTFWNHALEDVLFIQKLLLWMESNRFLSISIFLLSFFYVAYPTFQQCCLIDN